MSSLVSHHQYLARLRVELKGLSWALKRGKRHWHLIVDGRLLSGIPHGRIYDGGRWLRLRSLIRRHRRTNGMEISS
jgi:hypothetical protein